MARDSRGRQRGAEQGRRARGEDGGKSRVGSSGNRFSLTRKQQGSRKLEETPCIARGPHDASCICGGTRKIRTQK